MEVAMWRSMYHWLRRTPPTDELRLYADDPDGLVRACRQVAGAEHASMRRAQES